MKKVVMLGLCLLLAVVLAAGCGGGQQTSGSDGESSGGGSSNEQGQSGQSSSEEMTTLTLMTSNDEWLPAIKAVAAEAEKKINIKLEYDIRPEGAEGDNFVKTRLATNDMSDLLFYNSGSLLQALNPEENFADLSGAPYVDRLLDSYKVTVSSGDQMFGVPVGSTNVGAMLYNKKVYADLGLSVPKTWDEFMANNEVIKQAGKTPVITTYKTTWTSQLFVLGSYFNVQAENPNFAKEYTAGKAKYATTPAALRGFEITAEPYAKGYVNEDFQAALYDHGIQMLAEGTGVHYPMLSNALVAIEQNYPDQVNDIGVFPIPSDSADINGLTVWMPNSIYVNKKGDHVEAAKKWIEFYMSPEAQDIFKQHGNPVGPYVIEGMELPEDTFEGVKDMQPYFDSGNTAPALEFLSPIKGPNLENILIGVGSGLIDPLEGAKQYDEDVRKQALQLGLDW